MTRAGATSDTQAPASRRVLARRGEGGYRQYRIPALAAAGDDLLCAYDGRPDLDDLPAPIDLLLRRSADSGRTWSDPEVVRTGTGFTGFGDPSLLVDPVTGTVLLFHAAGERAGFFESGNGDAEDDPDTQHCDLSVSTDAGRTWSHRRLTTQLRRTGNAHLTGERIAGMFAASGTGCAITAGPYAGRLVQPFVLRISGRIKVACALSDDHGAAWRLARPLAAELNESSVCELPTGELLLHSRGTGHRLAARSTDGGETFGPVAPVADLTDPSVNGSVLQVGGMLLASHLADPQLRRNAVVSRSDDGGASWQVLRTVEPGSAGYTQLAVLPDGGMGLAYEADGYQEIRFERVPLLGGAGPGAGSAHPTGGASPAGASTDPAGSTAPTTTGCGWVRTHRHGVVLDLVLRAVVPARPEVWVESGPTHAIDLAGFADVDASVFKEIGQDRGAEAVQVLRTRESLATNLGPVAPGVRAGDTLEVHARLRNEGGGAIRVGWGDQERLLAPGEYWLRRDLVHRVSTAEVVRRVAEVSSAVALEPDRPQGETRTSAPSLGGEVLDAVLAVPLR